MSNWRYLSIFPLVAISYPVHAETYFSVEQAQQAIFPGETLTKSFITLSDDQAKQIKDKSDVKVRVKDLQLWKTSGGGFFLVDEVLGKHEFITYAIGLNADGSVKQIEIMEYRETYGYQIREVEWRGQFTGKTSAAPLKLEGDIKNISGATLSCKHVTDGVKRILATYDIALKA